MNNRTPRPVHTKPAPVDPEYGRLDDLIAILCPTCGRHAWQEREAGTWDHTDNTDPEACWQYFLANVADTRLAAMKTENSK